MSLVSDRWLSQRQPPTGPQGAPGPTGSTGVTAVVETAGATGDAPISEIINLEAIFPASEYGGWTMYANQLGPTGQALEIYPYLSFGGEWSLRVSSWPDASAAVPAEQTIRIQLFPPGDEP